MTIWILALLLLASLAMVGYNQGAIRVAISLVGILLGALLAIPIGPLLKPVFAMVGIKNPVLVWLIPPFVVFVVILVIFKIAGMVVHRKIDVYYKYKTGDLRLALWRRLNHRLGLCLGLVNGTVYLLLISVVIYALGYWTTQMAMSDTDPRGIRYLNRVGKDLQTTGLTKAVKAIDPMPESYYEAADIVGTVYHNPLSASRLSRYPALLALAERPEFQDIANDTAYQEMLQKQVSIGEVLSNPKTKTIVNNPDLLKEIWTVVGNDLKDLRSFLETGKSPKYDHEKILGRWVFDVNSAINVLKRSRPNLTSVQLQQLKRFVFPNLAKTVFIATPDQQAILKGLPQTMPGATPAVADAPQTLRGQWKSVDTKYQLSFSENRTDMDAAVEGERLTIGREGMTLVFARED